MMKKLPKKFNLSFIYIIYFQAVFIDCSDMEFQTNVEGRAGW